MKDIKVLRSELGRHRHLMMLNPVEFNLMRERKDTSSTKKN